MRFFWRRNTDIAQDTTPPPLRPFTQIAAEAEWRKATIREDAEESNLLDRVASSVTEVISSKSVPIPVDETLINTEPFTISPDMLVHIPEFARMDVQLGRGYLNGHRLSIMQLRNINQNHKINSLWKLGDSMIIEDTDWNTRTIKMLDTVVFDGTPRIFENLLMSPNGSYNAIEM